MKVLSRRYFKRFVWKNQIKGELEEHEIMQQ